MSVERLQYPYLKKMEEQLEDCEYLKIIHPRVADNYVETQGRLLLRENPNITIFHGGALDITRASGTMQDIWVMPTVVHGSETSVNFDVIVLNCHKEKSLRGKRARVDLTSEFSLKLQSQSNPSAMTFAHTLHNSQEAEVAIHPNLLGMLAYPVVADPLSLPSPAEFEEQLKILGAELELNLLLPDRALITQFIDAYRFHLYEERETGMISIPEQVSTDVGPLYRYRVFMSGDIWQNYEIYATHPLESFRKSGKTLCRLDTACDSCMLYQNESCEGCHQQLLDTLRDMQEGGGMVIHILDQSNRGYGENTLFETELMKQGKRSVFRPPGEPLDATESSRYLFGEHYDLRTFDRIGDFLWDLGIRAVTVITDKKDKVLQLGRNPGMELSQQPTKVLDSVNGTSSHRHVQAKFKSGAYGRISPEEIAAYWR